MESELREGGAGGSGERFKRFTRFRREVQEIQEGGSGEREVQEVQEVQEGGSGGRFRQEGGQNYHHISSRYSHSRNHSRDLGHRRHKYHRRYHSYRQPIDMYCHCKSPSRNLRRHTSHGVSNRFVSKSVCDVVRKRWGFAEGIAVPEDGTEVRE